MNFFKSILVVVVFTLSIGMISETAMAQISVGASYEIRDEDPQNGFGLRLERQILQKVPIVDLSLRGHFSYFNDDISYEDRTYSTDITSYDYGLAAVGGVSLGLMSPYVGLGLGASTLDVNRESLDAIDRPANSDDSSIYWNSFVGAKISPVPFVSPFVEYRFEDASDYKSELSDIKESNGRLIFGVSLSF